MSCYPPINPDRVRVLRSLRPAVALRRSWMQRAGKAQNRLARILAHWHVAKFRHLRMVSSTPLRSFLNPSQPAIEVSSSSYTSAPPTSNARCAKRTGPISAIAGCEGSRTLSDYPLLPPSSPPESSKSTEPDCFNLTFFDESAKHYHSRRTCCMNTLVTRTAQHAMDGININISSAISVPPLN